MDEKSLTLVRRSFLRLIPVSEIAVDMFRERLVLLSPELGPLLRRRGAYSELGLSRTLALMVEALSEPDRMVRLARRIGYRYSHLGVKPEHYPAVGDALIWTLGHLVEETMGKDAVQAWREAYDVLSKHMAEGASWEPKSSIFS